MLLQDLKPFLLYCTLINYAILLVWFAAFVLAHDFVYRLHSRWSRCRWRGSMRCITAAWPSTRSVCCCSIWRHYWRCACFPESMCRG